MNCDWRTAKKRYELQQQIENGLPLPLKEHKSILDPYVDIINAKLEISGITASAIYHFLIDTTDYSGKYGLVKNYVKKHNVNGKIICRKMAKKNVVFPTYFLYHGFMI